MTVLLTLSVIVAGIATYNKLAVNDLPAVDYPVIQVTCSYPGANPTTMANNIATPLEKQFLQIPGLDIITSQSTQSNTSFTLQFVLSKSITDAATDVQAAIQRATGKLPIDLPSPPTFTKTNPNDQAVYLLGLLSDTLQSLVVRLEPYCEGGAFAHLTDAETTIPDQTTLTLFDIAGLPDRLVPPMILQIVDHIEGQVPDHDHPRPSAAVRAR